VRHGQTTRGYIPLVRIKLPGKSNLSIRHIPRPYFDNVAVPTNLQMSLLRNLEYSHEACHDLGCASVLVFLRGRQ
jgi:hypothetical protein